MGVGATGVHPGEVLGAPAVDVGPQWIGGGDDMEGKSDIVNLTPHPLIVVDEDGRELLTVAPSGTPLRLKETRRGSRTIAVGEVAVEIEEVSYAEPSSDLPKPREGVLYFVSMLTALSLRDREDLIFPLGVVRDADGRILGCRSFGRVR